MANQLIILKLPCYTLPPTQLAHNSQEKRNDLAAKEITSRQKEENSRPKKKPLSPHALFYAVRTLLFPLPWGYFFSRESFTFAVRLFFCAVRTLLFLLPWGYSFMQWVFFFCRESFTFAVRFSFAVRFFRLPWGYFFSRESFNFPVRVFFLPWGFFVCRKVISLAVSLSLFPWGYSFCCEVFSFALSLFLIAARFFLLPWVSSFLLGGSSFCRESLFLLPPGRYFVSFAVTVAGHYT